MVTFLRRIWNSPADRAALAPLYDAIVAQARQPHWYRNGGVPDTIDGRFDMLASVLALVLLRLESLGAPGREPAARLTELFVADMDGQLRQRGVGDLVVGRHVGQMVGQLGGRLGAYREGLADGGDLPGAIARNIHRGADAPADARAHVESGLRALATALAIRDLPSILTGDIA